MPIIMIKWNSPTAHWPLVHRTNSNLIEINLILIWQLNTFLLLKPRRFIDSTRRIRRNEIYAHDEIYVAYNHSQLTDKKK